MKSLIAGIALLTALGSAPAVAEQYLYDGNGYHWNHKPHHHNNNDYDGWQVGGAFLGGLLIGGALGSDRGYYAPPPVYAEPPQYYQPAPRPRWYAPRYCESMLYYDAWGNLVQSRDCYR